MATGDIAVVLNNKQTVGLIEFRDWFFELLDTWTGQVTQAMWDEDGWFAYDNPAITSSGEGLFTVEAGKNGTDGIGNLIETGVQLELPNELPSTYDVDIPFPNALGVDYMIGLMEAVIPTKIKSSGQSGIPQYTGEEYIVGYKLEPEAVVVNGADLKFKVDNLFEPGIHHVGREVYVYLKTPLSADSAEAFAVGTVAWEPFNIANVTGHLGQTAPSTVASDYYVVLLGPRVQIANLNNDPGVLMVGTVTGTGPGGGAATAFDYTVVTLFFAWPDLWNVIEVGPNGDLKIRVWPHPSDVPELYPITQGTPQVSVRDPATGYYLFYIDRLGQIVQRDVATGNVLFHVDFNGDIGEFGGAIKSSLATITLQDVNTGTIPLSESGGQANVPSAYQEDTIMGVMAGGVTDDLFSSLTVEGAEPSDGGGLNLDLTAGLFLYQGTAHRTPADTLALTDNADNYVYYDGLGEAYDVFTSPEELDARANPIAKVTTLAGAIAEIIDTRKLIRRIDQQVEILVGDTTGTTSYGDLVPHFTSIGKALKAIAVWNEGGIDARQYRIRVIDNCTEDEGTLVVPADNITIEGVRNGTGIGDKPRIDWDFDSHLFDINDKTGLAFKDLAIKFIGTQGGTTFPEKICFTNVGGTIWSNIRIERVILENGDGFAGQPGIADTVTGSGAVDIIDCVGTLLAGFGVLLRRALVGGVLRVRDCSFGRAAPFVSQNVDGIRTKGWYESFIEKNYTAAFPGLGIWEENSLASIVDNRIGGAGSGMLVSAPRARVRGNDLSGLGSGFGISIASTAAGAVASENKISEPGTDGIQVFAENVIVSENQIVAPGARGVEVGSAALDCKVRGNRITQDGGDGIYVDAENCEVSGNTLLQSASSGSGRIVGTDNATFLMVVDNKLEENEITIPAAALYPVVSGNQTRGGNIFLGNAATQLGIVLGNNLRFSAGVAGTITAHANDDVAHNML